MNRRYRLRRNSDFSRVYRRGVSASNALMVLLVNKNGLPIPRVGFSVSKKIGNSVVRNRVKRILREQYRALLPRMRAGRDYVVIARAPIVGRRSADVGRGAEVLLTKLDMLPRSKV